MPRLAHAGDDDPPLGAEQQRHSPAKTTVEPMRQRSEGVRLGGEHSPGDREVVVGSEGGHGRHARFRLIQKGLELAKRGRRSGSAKMKR